MDRFENEPLDTSDGAGARQTGESDRSIGNEVRDHLQRFAERRKDDLAARLDEFAAECVRGAQNLERAQPATAAVLRTIGARLGGFAETLEERSAPECARTITRGIGDHPALFVGGLIGGLFIGSYLFGARGWRRERA